MTLVDSAPPQGNNGYALAIKTNQSGGITLPHAQEQEIITYCEDCFQKARRARLQFERQWYINLAFYFGRQYAQWTDAYTTAMGVYQKLYEPKAPPWRVRLVANKTRRFIRKEHAQLTKENPQPFVIPSSTDDDDLAKARAAENIYDFLWRDLKAKRVIRRMAWWLCITGNGFTKDWFNPVAKDSGGQLGRITFEHTTPYHIYVPDIDEEDIEGQPQVTHVMSKTPDYVESTWGKTLQPDSTGSEGLLEQKFLQALGVDKQSGYDHVAIREMWMKPCKRYPDGAVIIWAQQQLLAMVEGFPYGTDEYPFTKFDHVPTGKFYADSIITDLLPIQKEYNRTRSQIIEAKNRTAKPQLLAPKGSVDPNKITTEPGLIIFYTPGFEKPTPLELTPLPAYVLEELNRCEMDMQDIASQHEVSKGSAPAGVSAATAISYLQEQDDTSLANTISSIEEGVEKIGKHLLLHVQNFWVQERTVKVVGSDGAYEAVMLAGADIAGNTDLNIQSGSAMPRSRAAKQAFIMQLGQMGWIPPDRALRYLDMAETGRLYEELQIDVRQAQRENLKMLNGQQVSVNTWDEHYAHILEHNNERKKQKYESSQPQIQQMFEMHVQMHQQAIQMNQAKMQALMPGGGQPMPGASGVPGQQPPGGGGQQGPPQPHARPVTQPVAMPAINPLQQQGAM